MWSTLSLLLGLLLVVPASSQPLDPFRVKLRVSAESRLQDRVENYLAHELRRLGDVEMGEEIYRWLLHILVIDLKPNRGYVLSLASLEKTTIELNNQVVYIPDLHAVYVDTDLRTLCARAVTAFDSTSLMPARAARRVQSQPDGR